MKWQISFEIELPTESMQEAEDWAEFVIGFNGSLSGKNACVNKELPASWDDLVDGSLRVRCS